MIPEPQTPIPQVTEWLLDTASNSRFVPVFRATGEQRLSDECDEMEEALNSGSAAAIIDEIPDVIWAWRWFDTPAGIDRAWDLLERAIVAIQPTDYRVLLKLILTKWALTKTQRDVLKAELFRCTSTPKGGRHD